jgi:hypothetical protein
MAPSFFRSKAAECSRRAQEARTALERDRYAGEARAWLEIAEVEERITTEKARQEQNSPS